MYEGHSNHLRGDEVAGTGFGYECLWRSFLMLGLGASDTLTIYRGEDACITKKVKEDGQTIYYYQIKHTIRSWTPALLKGFFSNVDRELAAHANVSYAFCTNGPFTLEGQRAFEEINQKYGNRLRYEKWEPHPEDPIGRISRRIRQILEKHFHPQEIIGVLDCDRIDNCCNNLLALEARFKLEETPSVSGDRVWESTGIKQLVEEIPSLIFGERLVKWPSWVEKANTQDTDPILSATRSITVGSDGIAQDLEDEVFDFSCKWGSTPSESHLYLISGASGTGKTWLLLRLAMRLSQHLPVYWADELATGRDPRLSALTSWENKPAVALIDNLIEGEWSGLVREALRSQPPLLVIGTTSRPLHDRRISDLHSRSGGKFTPRELGPLLKEEEVNKLVRNKRNGVVARAEQKALKSTNIRYAVRLLENRENKTYLVNGVYNLWHRDDCQAWVMPLILCSSQGIKAPRLMLRDRARLHRNAAQEFPDDLWPAVLRMKRDDDEVLWLEDPDVAKDVLEKIKSEISITKLEITLLEEAVGLLRQVDVESPLHRQFARRIVREFCETFPHLQESLLEGCKDKILQLLPLETRWALAYLWLPFLPRVERMIEARKAAEAFLSASRVPQSVADVVLLIEAFGDEHARQIITQDLQHAHQWVTEPWATFIEHLRPLNDQSKRELLDLAIPVLKIAPLNKTRLLGTRNIAVDLITLIEDFGQPDHRNWLLTALNSILPEPPTEEALKRQHLLPQYFKLVSRCVMQPRSGLALDVTRQLLTAGLQNEATLKLLYAETYDRYRATYDNEVRAAYHLGALTRGLNYAMAEAAPTKANLLWEALLGFAGVWATREERNRIEDLVYSFLDTVLKERLPPRLFQNTLLGCGRDLVAKGGVTTDKLRVLLELIRQSPNSQAALQMLVILSGAIARQDPTKDNLAKQAREGLKKLACSKASEVRDSATSFIKNLGEHIGIGSPERPELLAIPELPSLKEPIVIELLYCIGNVPWDDVERQELANAIYDRWYENTFVTRGLLLTLLNLMGSQKAKAILDRLTQVTPDDPDVLFISCTWEARFGDPRLAQEHLVRALKIYLTRKEGGHLQQVSRAYADLARCSNSPKLEIFELCSALTRLGPLKALREEVR